MRFADLLLRAPGGLEVRPAGMTERKDAFVARVIDGVDTAPHLENVPDDAMVFPLFRRCALTGRQQRLVAPSARTRIVLLGAKSLLKVGALVRNQISQAVMVTSTAVTWTILALLLWRVGGGATGRLLGDLGDSLRGLSLLRGALQFSGFCNN